MLLTTPFPPRNGDGSGGLDPSKRAYLDLGPDFRFAPPGNREAWTHFHTPGGRHVVVRETVGGGKLGKTDSRRPDPGEAVGAVSLEGSESFALLSPGAAVPHTDAGWERYAADEEARVAASDIDRRAEAFRSQAGFWDGRRELARRWLAETPEVPVPPLPPGFPAHNAIDHFIAEKLAAARKTGEAVGTVDYARDVKPILEAK